MRAARAPTVAAPAALGAEIVSVYFEDPGIRPGVVNLAVRKGLWPFAQKFAAAFRTYAAAKARAEAAAARRAGGGGSARPSLDQGLPLRAVPAVKPGGSDAPPPAFGLLLPAWLASARAAVWESAAGGLLGGGRAAAVAGATTASTQPGSPTTAVAAATLSGSGEDEDSGGSEWEAMAARMALGRAASGGNGGRRGGGAGRGVSARPAAPSARSDHHRQPRPSSRDGRRDHPLVVWRRRALVVLATVVAIVV